ncbi:MAG TPA: hypothetical protein VGO91_16145, partial [Pyrinomonadaceae bacterium]|nr:hypothetical protein [Pyrinomonadaceae bacterium]
MTGSQISGCELEIIQAAINGKTADFRDRRDSAGQAATMVIRGYVIRHLLIGLPLPTQADKPAAPITRHTITSSGVRVRGARIEGVLDLSDCAGRDGNGCFPLLLEDCILTGEDEGAYQDPSARPQPTLDARHAILSRLSLKNCRAGFIDLTDAELLGDLELDGLKALSEGGQCRVEAKNTRIDGSIKASTVNLNLRQARIDKSETTPADYALALGGAEIAGSVLLRPGFVADGGVSIINAHIKGDLWADGAHLIAQGNYALHGQFAHVDGVLGLTCLFTRAPEADPEESHNQSLPPERFRADGAVSFLSAELGSLNLRGAFLHRKADEEINTFILSLASVRQTVYMNQWSSFNEQGESSLIPFEADYNVNFEGTKIAGSLVA